MRYLSIILVILIFPCKTIWGQCDTNCVWPGDLNANGIANNLDILALGFSINTTGPARTNMSTNWEALEAEEWAGSLPFSTINYKHCDADGNGIIDDMDRLPVSINYNQTNDLFTGLLGSEIPGEDLFVVAQNNETSPSGTFVLDIHLGTATNPINDIYGIGFQIDVDTDNVESVNFDFSDSWIGQDEEVLAYGKYEDEIEHIATAITRLDGTPVSGFGKIARVEIVITDVVLGLMQDSTACLPFLLEFENVLGLDTSENDMMITIQNDSLTLKHPSQLTSTLNLDIAHQVSIFPNPVSNHLTINTTSQNIINRVRFLDALGRAFFSSHSNVLSTQYQIDVSSFPKGIFFVEIITDKGRSLKKIIIQ